MPTGRGRRPERAAARPWWRRGARLLLVAAWLLPAAPDASAVAEPPGEAAVLQAQPAPGPATPSAPVAPAPETLTDLPAEEAPAEPPVVETPWLESSRLAVERGLGAVLDRFDRFFGDDRRLDLEAPSSRLRVKGWARTSQERSLEAAVSAAVSLKLPRLQAWLGNARVVVSAENAGTPPPQGAAEPGVEPVPPVPPLPATPAAGEAARSSSGAAELRFDFVRHGLLLVDTGAGLRLEWPPIPYARLRGHLVLPLAAGLVFRFTETAIVEMGPRGIGSLTDLELERVFWEQLRLRLEGHGLINQLTRGVEWSTQFTLQWKVHRRTGLYAGVGAAGFGTPSPALALSRVFVGARQDVWHDWVFLELEPELYSPHPPGTSRTEVAAVTLRVEVALDARPGPAEVKP